MAVFQLNIGWLALRYREQAPSRICFVLCQLENTSRRNPGAI